MKHRIVLTGCVFLASVAAVLLADVDAAAVLPHEPGAAAESDNTVSDTALDLSKSTIEVSRMGAMLIIQYRAEDDEAMATLQRLSAPTVEIYKDDLLLTSGTLEFG